MTATRSTDSASLVARVVLVLACGLVVLVCLAAAVVLVVPGRFSSLPGVADCTASGAGRNVDLSTEQAERAASIGARGVRLGLPPRTTSAALAGRLDLPEKDARVVAAALTGRAQHALSCRHGGDGEEEPDRLDAVGLTARAVGVRRDVDRAFGRQRVGGFAPGGVTTGHMPGSAHYEGRAVDVFFRPVDAASKQRGWAVAQYLVAHAERLEVQTVIFDGRIWTARRAAQGWRGYAPDTLGRPRSVALVLEHRDHVHVDVTD